MANSKQYSQLPVALEGYYKQLPSLPKGFTDFLVLVAPWAAIIFGVLGVIVGVLALIGGAALSGAAAMVGVQHNGFAVILSALGTLISSGLLVAAFSGLKRNSIIGWTRLFWSDIAWIVFSLLADLLNISLFGIIWTLILGAIALYFVFQIKSYYK